ncbi:hypothetical protein BDV28DRAFT_139168 [Aspergillus coremiiformis]|uniref:Uncharacterized protein n=1 Tax=Aspergillus coremiiformis TaxID=138285 RepID=A0A5N6YY99_9EURO|nr:hypothetical protein BDV28DRAFT_139168 [Aspergillus coremiiformis]
MFSVIIPGRPCLTDIVPVDPQPNGQSTKFAFTIPLAPDFSDLVVFFLPGTVLPPDTAAAIYIQFPDNGFRFIGALANEKPSAILSTSPPPNLAPGMTATLGISIEPVQSVAPQLATLEAEKGASGQLVRQSRQITTKVLAQRIIGNAFNFLASFASSDQDAVPLKAFRDWWTKFERKVDMDPTFLEREDPSASG